MSHPFQAPPVAENGKKEPELPIEMQVGALVTSSNYGDHVPRHVVLIVATACMTIIRLRNLTFGVDHSALKSYRKLNMLTRKIKDIFTDRNSGNELLAQWYNEVQSPRMGDMMNTVCSYTEMSIMLRSLWLDMEVRKTRYDFRMKRDQRLINHMSRLLDATFDSLSRDLTSVEAM